MALITGLEHVGIAARDTVALKDWYCKYLECEVVFDNGGTPPMFFIRFQDDSMAEIHPIAEDAPVIAHTKRGIGHICVSCDYDQFDLAAKRFQDLNVPEVSPPGAPGAEARNFFFRDPEGNVVQLAARKTPLV